MCHCLLQSHNTMLGKRWEMCHICENPLQALPESFNTGFGKGPARGDELHYKYNRGSTKKLPSMVSITAPYSVNLFSSFITLMI